MADIAQPYATWRRRLVPIALLGALAAVVIGAVGLVSPDLLTALRRDYYATSLTLYAVAAVRFGLGIVVILVAPTSRAPLVLRVLGALVCLQALTPILVGADHARQVLEFEAAQSATLLRLGAALSIFAACVVIFGVAGRPRL